MPFDVKPMVHKWWELGDYFYADTNPFHHSAETNNDRIGDYARVFVPNNCKKGGCHLHVYLHGC